MKKQIIIVISVFAVFAAATAYLISTVTYSLTGCSRKGYPPSTTYYLEGEILSTSGNSLTGYFKNTIYSDNAFSLLSEKDYNLNLYGVIHSRETSKASYGEFELKPDNLEILCDGDAINLTIQSQSDATRSYSYATVILLRGLKKTATSVEIKYNDENFSVNSLIFSIEFK